MLIKFYSRFFEVDDRVTDHVIKVRIIFFLMLIGLVVWLTAELIREMVRKQVISL